MPLNTLPNQVGVGIRVRFGKASAAALLGDFLHLANGGALAIEVALRTPAFAHRFGFCHPRMADGALPFQHIVDRREAGRQQRATFLDGMLL